MSEFKVKKFEMSFTAGITTLQVKNPSKVLQAQVRGNKLLIWILTQGDVGMDQPIRILLAKEEVPLSFLDIQPDPDENFPEMRYLGEVDAPGPDACFAWELVEE